MKTTRTACSVSFGLLLLLPACLAFPAADAEPRPRKAAVASRPDATAVEEARRKVAMLNDAYQILVQEIHAWYPNKTGQPIVAAVPVRDLQEVMTRKGWPASRFLGVTGPVMNPDHRPKDDFERKAVAAIRAGKDRYEEITPERLRVATVVPLEGGCFTCHWSEGKRSNRAAISWNLPLTSGRDREK
jgi:hypothetical protein